MANVARAVLTAALLSMAFFFGLVLLILLSFAGTALWMLLVFFIGYLDLVFVLLLLLWNKALVRRLRYIPLILLGVCVLVYGGGLGWRAYQDAIPGVNDQGLSLFEYEPFRPESKLARLPEESTLTLSGELPSLDCATALYPLAAAFVEAVYPPGEYGPKEDTPLFRQTGTEAAYSRLIEGEVDLIFVAGPSREQLDYAKAHGKELTLTPIGREAFVFFVNAANPVNGLTVGQVQGIYSGEFTNWKELGGKNNVIRAFQRPQNSGSQTALENLMQGKTLMQPPVEDIVSAMEGIIERTASYKNHKNAIGYSFRYFSTEMVQNNQIKLLALDGAYPDKDSIRDGSYPLASDFYAVTAGTENPNVPPFIEWILSSQGQYLVEETGYVSASLE